MDKKKGTPLDDIYKPRQKAWETHGESKVNQRSATACVYENNSPVELKELRQIFKIQQNISNLKNCHLKILYPLYILVLWNNSDTQHFYLAKLLLEIAQVGEIQVWELLVQ